MPISYSAEVKTGDEWTGNCLRFPSKASALAYATDLRSRWTLVTAVRVACSDDPVTMRENGTPLVGRLEALRAGSPVHIFHQSKRYNLRAQRTRRSN